MAGMNLAHAQDGVLSYRQLTAAGLADHDIRRRVRRRELVRLHPQVYIDHTGQPTWRQRAWAAVLAVGPAALCDVSALHAYEESKRWIDPGDHIHVAINADRRVAEPDGVKVHRRPLEGRVAWHLSPPRLKLEEAIIDVAARQVRDLDAVAVLAHAVGSGRTTAERLIHTLDARHRVKRGVWMRRVLIDIGGGSWSVLEHAYLTTVERPHHLPASRRQVRHVGAHRVAYRDAVLPGMTIIELDGRTFHSSIEQRSIDLDRDLEAAVDGHVTVRLGWRQVIDRPCATAAQLGTLLRMRGWSGHAAPCSPRCVA